MADYKMSGLSINRANNVITLTAEKVLPGKNRCPYLLRETDETNTHILNTKIREQSIKDPLQIMLP